MVSRGDVPEQVDGISECVAEANAVPRDMMVFSVDTLLEHSLQARRAIHIMTRRGELEVCRIGARSLLEPFPGKRLYPRRRKLTTLFEECEATLHHVLKTLFGAKGPVVQALFFCCQRWQSWAHQKSCAQMLELQVACRPCAQTRPGLRDISGGFPESPAMAAK